MTDLFSLAELAIIGGLGFFVLREFRKMFIETSRLRSIKEREGAKSKRWEGMFENLDLAIEQTEAMLFEMKAKNPPPTPEQLEPVEKRLRQLQTVQANQWWIEIMLKVLGPAADRMIKWVI